MFWDKVSGLYDFFENTYNKKVYEETGISVAKHIEVIKCADKGGQKTCQA